DVKGAPRRRIEAVQQIHIDAPSQRDAAGIAPRSRVDHVIAADAADIDGVGPQGSLNVIVVAEDGGADGIDDYRIDVRRIRGKVVCAGTQRAAVVGERKSDRVGGQVAAREIE